MSIKKGVKSSELWVVLVFILTPYLRDVGIDLQDVPAQVAEIAKSLQLESSNSGTTWLALAYVVGRQVLKFQQGIGSIEVKDA